MRERIKIKNLNMTNGRERSPRRRQRQRESTLLVVNDAADQVADVNDGEYDDDDEEDDRLTMVGSQDGRGKHNTLFFSQFC